MQPRPYYENVLYETLLRLRQRHDIITTMEKLIAGVKKLGLELTLRQLEQFRIYYQELMDWNKRVNLTAITDHEDVQIKHFLDSISVTLAFKPPLANADLHLIDVGSGAGLPGIPLKILFPNIKLALLEATAKKGTFLQHIRNTLGLDDIEIIVGRAEEVAHQTQYRERFDIALSRAVATLPVLVELALPFCTTGGSFITQKKGAIDKEISQAAKAINLLGGNLREVKKVELEELADERWLVVIDKVSPTPPQYPRRPGIPAKRPIL
ncbi:16S rRNA (guanine(527)-N(7))-methyltransferase RsmG [Chloroflexota bacterium]